MKRIVLLSLVLLLAFGASVWGGGSAEAEKEETTETREEGEPRYGGTLRFAIPILNNLDVVSVNQYGVNEYAQQFYETLVDIDANNEVVPLLMKSWDVSSDGLTHTWHLEEGVTFHNGNPFNAEVVKWNIMRKIEQKGPMWDSIPWADDPVTVVDDYTLEVELEKPFAAIYNTLAIKTFSMYDPQWVEEKGEDDLKTDINGTGPFMLDEYSVNEHLKLVKNPNYWQEGLPYLDGIDFIVVPENSTRVFMLQSGEVDVSTTISASDVGRLENRPNIKVESGVSSRVYYIALDNLTPALEDVKVRQAINYAVNKEGMIEPIFNNMVSLSGSSLLTEAVAGYHGSEPYYYNPEKAKELLAEAGWEDTDGDGFVDKDGENMELLMTNREGAVPGDTEVPVLVQADLAKVGIDVNIRNVDSATLITNLNKEREEVIEYDLCYLSWATFSGNAGYTLSTGIHSEAWPPRFWNYAWYENSKVDEYIEKGTSATNVKTQNENFAKAQEIAWDEAMNLFLFDALATAVMSEKVEGLYLDPAQGIWPSKYTWLDN